MAPRRQAVETICRHGVDLISKVHSLFPFDIQNSTMLFGYIYMNQLSTTENFHACRLWLVSISWCVIEFMISLFEDYEKRSRCDYFKDIYWNMWMLIKMIKHGTITDYAKMSDFFPSIIWTAKISSIRPTQSMRKTCTQCMGPFLAWTALLPNFNLIMNMVLHRRCISSLWSIT